MEKVLNKMVVSPYVRPCIYLDIAVISCVHELYARAMAKHEEMMGKHIYYIRGRDDDFSVPATIEPSPVFVNMWGVFISDEPIRLFDENNADYINIEESPLSFLVKDLESTR